MVFSVKQAGARRAGQQMSRAAREMRSVILAEMRAEEGELKSPFEVWAPYDHDERDSYHLRDNITVTISSRNTIEADVKVRAVSPENGFDYLDVTRFGRGPIVKKGPGYLRWVDGSGVHYAKSVGPWSPGGDWVAEAAPFAEQVAAGIVDRVGRAIYTRLL